MAYFLSAERNSTDSGSVVSFKEIMLSYVRTCYQILLKILHIFRNKPLLVREHAVYLKQRRILILIRVIAAGMCVDQPFLNVKIFSSTLPRK